MLARLISSVFEPMSSLFAIAAIGGWRAGLRESALFLYVAYLSFLIGGIGVFRLFLMGKDKTDWDVSERKKRIRPLLLLIGFFLINRLAVALWYNQELSFLFTILMAWFLGFLLLTLRWKVSGHVGIVTLAVGLLLRWYGWSVWPVVPIIPLVAWARVVGENHTVGQVVAGAIYSTLILMLMRG